MTDYSDFSVLVVDDTAANIDILVEVLGDGYEVRVALDGETALEHVAEDKPDLILLDIIMPGMDGYKVCEILKNNPETCKIPIIFLTAMAEEQDEARGLALGAVDYVTKPFSPGLVKARVNNQLELKKHQDHLAELVNERTRELALTQEATIYSLASLAETRDPETGGHILRTQRYVRELAQILKELPAYSVLLDDITIDLIYKSAPLHDIGKVGVEDRILLKPGKLTDQEFIEMKKHTIYGRDTLRVAEKILGDNSFMRHAREIAYTHHEKWDGSGYPDGISGTAIPVSGRLMAIADVYDALISKRVYKPPFSHREAVCIIREGKGTHFDPDMVDGFLSIEEKFRQIAIEFADSQEEREVLEK
ncbi:response regulator [Desulfobacula phenolica]|uniref:Putative two-component system response regulator n=1 Tax=Desulfobacula phenolica TaxID=90732 RepID=A0A1H2E2C3_9BACT|nr:two-component system response regulator [Desulfobacula phenolica]SDT89225.1 putative two-component system response regulator [Desulfobacula phenolica]